MLVRAEESRQNKRMRQKRKERTVKTSDNSEIEEQLESHQGADSKRRAEASKLGRCEDAG